MYHGTSLPPRVYTVRLGLGMAAILIGTTELPYRQGFIPSDWA